MKYKVFWCKVNKYYTDEWLNSEYLREKNGLFVASCVVTDKAKKKWLKFIKDEVKEIKDNEKIFISWCGAFEKWEENKNFFEVYSELKTYENKIEILWESPNQNKKDWNNNDKKINLSDKLKNLKSIYTKKFIVIQWGCDSFCTFCLTVIKRGKHYYRTKEDIVDEITDFEMKGWKEVVITWVNLCAWWLTTTNDFKESKFDELLSYILEKTEIPRIRISSLWPEFINDKVLKLFENKRIYPHFHFSIQSGSSNVLSAMKRHYDGKYMRDLLTKTLNVKREDWVSISIWADLIVWFPGETENDFLETYELVKNYNITKLHAFPFSNHTLWEHVPASYFKDQIDEKVKKERLDKLLKVWEEVRESFINTQKWKQLEVLIESIKWDEFKWWSENYIECTNENFKIISWKIAKNEIVSGYLI
jgi:threonylcarbamoyladenosine tRNA methylthiotransferase MtaB